MDSIVQWLMAFPFGKGHPMLNGWFFGGVGMLLGVLIGGLF